MKKIRSHTSVPMAVYVLALGLIIAFAFWLKSVNLESSWQRAGMVNFSLGLVMLAAFLSAQVLRFLRLPLLTGYIFAGILAGPHVSGFLTEMMVQRFRFMDDLALSFIALTAGGALNLNFLLSRKKAILLNITFLALVVFALVFLFVLSTADHFSFMHQLLPAQVTALAILLGVVAVARSPSSAIAIISECRACGIFTETVLGVTVAMDVLIIILFTLALTLCKMLLVADAAISYQALLALSLEMLASMSLGALSGRAISFYIGRAGHDLPLFLLFYAFGVTKASHWFGHFMQSHYGFSLELEPLLICISAGFTVQNFSKMGTSFMESLDRVALPIYVLFFSLAGASLDLGALRLTWPFALSLAVVRALGLCGATWLAGTLSGDPVHHRRVAAMAYLTQAGVAIGLTQLAQRHFPSIGVYLTTTVLAVITINQLVGPVTFKMALNLVGEAGRR